MKYYLYQSDSKVNMFFNQKNNELLAGIAIELGFDWKILSGKVSKEFESRQNKTNKMEIVESFIRKKEKIVSFEKNGNWISGKLRMSAIEFQENSETIFYLGETNNTILLLGGSAKHLLGGDKRESVTGDLSHTNRLISSLQKNLNRINLSDAEIDIYDSSIGDGDFVKPWKAQIEVLKSRREFDFDQNLEFLARTLIINSIKDKRFVLATPLYVALSNENY